MRGITLKELYEIKEYGLSSYEHWKKDFIFEFAPNYAMLEGAVSHIIFIIEHGGNLLHDKS